jgi:5,10-methylenetetrahydrofolate reductase
MLRVEQQALYGAQMSTTVQVSFEFFPPNDDAMAEHLWAAVERRAPLQPEFGSVDKQRRPVG